MIVETVKIWLGEASDTFTSRTSLQGEAAGRSGGGYNERYK